MSFKVFFAVLFCCCCCCCCCCGWWLVVGGWWLVVGGWWLVVGGWWLVVGGWWWCCWCCCCCGGGGGGMNTSPLRAPPYSGSGWRITIVNGDYESTYNWRPPPCSSMVLVPQLAGTLQTGVASSEPNHLFWLLYHDSLLNQKTKAAESALVSLYQLFRCFLPK